MREITLDLMCELSEAELNERGQEMSTQMLRHDELEQQRREVTKELSEEIKGVRGRLRSLSLTIRKKSESRAVACAVEFHTPEVGLKRISRKDTGELVRDEPMNADERQNNLFGEIEDLRRIYGRESNEPPLPEAEPPSTPA